MPYDELEPYRPSWSQNPGYYQACTEGMTMAPEYDTVSWSIICIAFYAIFFSIFTSIFFQDFFQYLVRFIYAVYLRHSVISHPKIISIFVVVLLIPFVALSFSRDSLKISEKIVCMQCVRGI